MYKYTKKANSRNLGNQGLRVVIGGNKKRDCQAAFPHIDVMVADGGPDARRP